MKRRDQGFLLHSQMVSVWHRLLRRVLQCVSLTTENDGKPLTGFNFMGKEFLTFRQFVVETSFEGRALTVVNCQIDVERS